VGVKYLFSKRKFVKLLKLITDNTYKLVLIVFLLLFLVPSSGIFCQNPSDSIFVKYKEAGTYRQKYRIISTYLYGDKANDSVVKVRMVKLLSHFKSISDEVGVDFVEMQVALGSFNKSDYISTLNRLLPIASRFKERNDTNGLIIAYSIIGDSYEFSKNYPESISTRKKLIPIYLAQMANKKYMKDRLVIMYTVIGSIYAMSFNADSGLVYTQKSLALANELKNDTLLVYPLSTLSENYIVKKDFDIALPFLRKSLVLAYKTGLDSNNIGFIYNDFAQLFSGTKQYDSGNFYSSMEIDSGNNGITGKETMLRAYECHDGNYDITGNLDSSNKYYRLAGIVKDSLYSIEKAKRIEAINFREQLYEQELKEEKVRADDERSQNIQYALIALGIIILSILFLMLSRSFITSTRLITFLGILALLVVFEFLNLLLHPLLEDVTHHSPILMLLCLVGIASLLIPLHHKLEKWTTNKLVEKNKEIRLANAKKTIEELEGQDRV